MNAWIRRTGLSLATALGVYLSGVALSDVQDPSGDELVGNSFDISGVGQVGYTIKATGHPAQKLHPLASVEGTIDFGVTATDGVGACTFDGFIIGPSAVMNSTWKNRGDSGIADFKDAYQTALSGNATTTVKRCRFKNCRAQSSLGIYFVGTLDVKLRFQSSGVKGRLSGKVPVGGFGSN